MTDIPVIFLTGLLAIQKKSFDKINAGDQIIVKQEIDHVFKQLDSLNRSDNEKATEALKNYGIEYVKPDPEEIRRWKNLSDQAIANMASSGIVTQEAVDQVLQHLSEYRKAQ